MKVLLARGDAGGCAFYRMQEPARVVAAQFDVELRVTPYIDVEASKDLTTGEVTVHEVKEDVDLIVIQRPLKGHLLRVIEQAQRQGIACAVEFDDNFSAVHRSNRAARYIDPVAYPEENYEWAEQSAAIADLVIASTPALIEQYGSHGRTAVIRNCVPESIKDVKRVARQVPNIGWTGTIQTHPTDLQATSGGVARAFRDNAGKAGIYVVGDSFGVTNALGIDKLVHIPMSGWVPLENYYETIAKTIDLGIVPLDMIAFNDAKSALKGLEFAALGIPFVASPTPEYLRLAEQGVGEIATNSSEWRKKLNVWLSNGRKRTTDGQRYRDIVLSEHTYEANAWRWHQAWRQAIENRKSQDDS